MMETAERRVAFLTLAGITIAAGLVVHVRGATLGVVARDVIGDALWAVMIVWWTGVFAPRARIAVRGVSAYAFCAGVELSQLVHLPVVDAARATTLGNLVLGSGFDSRDLVSYGAGVALALLLESAAVSRRKRHAAAV